MKKILSLTLGIFCVCLYPSPSFSSLPYSEELNRKPNSKQTMHYNDDWTIKKPIDGGYAYYTFNLDHTPKSFNGYAKKYVNERNKLVNRYGPTHPRGYEYLGKNVYIFPSGVLDDYAKKAYPKLDGDKQEMCKQFLRNYGRSSLLQNKK